MKNYHDISDTKDRINIAKAFLEIDAKYKLDIDQNQYERNRSIAYSEINEAGTVIERRLAFNEEINSTILKLNDWHRNMPIATGNNRILFMVEDGYLNNCGGVYTFLKHFTRLAKNMGYIVDVLVDKPNFDTFDEEIKTLGVSVHFPYLSADDVLFYDFEKIEINSKDYYDKVVTNLFYNGVSEYVSEYGTPKLAIANTYASTKALSIFNKKNMNKVSYTHIGDIMDEENKNILDFGSELTRAYLELLDNIDFKIGTQTDGVKSRLLNVLPNRTDKDVEVLYEPYQISGEVYSLTDDRKGILMIGNNYPRKNYEAMFNLVAPLGLPVTIMCNDKNAKIDGEISLSDLAKKCRLSSYRFIENLDNKFVIPVVKSHKMLLHLAEIEVLPYAVLEALPHIPVIINGNAKWTDGFFEEAIKINPDNKIESIKKIIQVYGNPFLYPTLDLDEYKNKAEKSWRKVLIK